MKNYFIAIEGIDGSGKDTQLTNLMDEIRSDNNELFGNKYSNIWITREPTKITESGKNISQLLKGEEMSKEEATKLFISDRIEHSEIIRKILNHSHVLSSRYDLSTLTYQMSQGMKFNDLYKLHNYTSKNGALIPDLTIVFDLPVDIALERIGGRDSDRECFEKKDFLQKTRENTFYCIEKLKKLDNRKILIVDGNQNQIKVKTEMINGIKKYLK